MRNTKAMQVMSALSQTTRLEVFRLLADIPKGLPAGELATAVKVAPSALSSHLAILSHAGLVKSSKSGRTITYRASMDSRDRLLEFLGAIGRPGSGAIESTNAEPDQ